MVEHATFYFGVNEFILFDFLIDRIKVIRKPEKYSW